MCGSLEGSRQPQSWTQPTSFLSPAAYNQHQLTSNVDMLTIIAVDH